MKSHSGGAFMPIANEIEISNKTDSQCLSSIQNMDDVKKKYIDSDNQHNSQINKNFCKMPTFEEMRKNDWKKPPILLNPEMIVYGNGSWYHGQISNGNKCGDGVYYYKDGSIYKGFYKDDYKSGEGEYIGTDQYYYKGQWKNGQKHGKGVESTPNLEGKVITWDTYEGEFQDDKYYGNGKLTINSQKLQDEQLKRLGTNTKVSYVGKWENGKKHGVGTEIYHNGDIYHGFFKNDLRHQRGRYIDSMGNEYDGEYYQDKFHGQGTIKKIDGSTYTGEFKDNRRHGKGRLIYPNQMVYEGEYVNDKKHGSGVEFKIEKDGPRTLFTGKWENGKKVVIDKTS